MAGAARYIRAAFAARPVRAIVVATLVGAFSQFTVHAYEGCGRFRFGLVEVGRNCTIGAGAGLGMIKVEDDVRILPGTVVSPYYPRIKAGTVVGYDPPPKSAPSAQEQSETVEG